MEIRVVPFSQLETKDRGLLKRVNYTSKSVEGQENENWTDVSDPKYGGARHVVVIDDEKNTAYDKLDLDWQPAAFVVVCRRQGERIEFLLPKERRVLLKDENSTQGNVFIQNIPQGLVHAWDGETPEQAALRELKEETGLEPINLVPLGEVYFDAANSQTAMPFFLAEVPAKGLDYNQQTQDTEEIIVGEEDWFALEDLPKLKLQCAKTMSGLFLATGFLGLWPNASNDQKGNHQPDSSEPPLHQQA